MQCCTSLRRRSSSNGSSPNVVSRVVSCTLVLVRPSIPILISCSGTDALFAGMGGAIFPFIMEGLITRFGYRMAMVSLAIGFGVLGAGALSLIKPRIPVPQKGSPEARLARRIDRRFLQRSTLYAFTGAILFNSLGGFIPSVWIPGESQIAYIDLI